MTSTAKVFWSGRSQAVRLPKEFRFDTTEVSIRREGNAVVLEPVGKDEWAWLNGLGPLDEDAIAGALEEPEPQRRPDLDKLDEL